MLAIEALHDLTPLTANGSVVKLRADRLFPTGARRLRRSRKTPVLDVCPDVCPVAGGNIEFVNPAALVHTDTGKIPKCGRIIDER